MQATTLLKQALAEFTPPKRQLISQWGEENFELPETSAEPGKWHPSRAPYQSGILDAVCEAGVQKVTLMCSAQIGKTIILLMVICYLIDLDPCSMMMTQPTTNMAEMFSKEKLSSAITNVKPVSKKIIQKSRNATSTILMKMFAGGFLRLAGANSPSSLASMSIRAYFGDEIDKYPNSAGKEGDPVKLAIQRTETFWNWLVFLVSTPSIKEDSRIEDEFEESDRRRFFVPCPHCGHRQHLVWERFQYADKDLETADPSSGVYYICQACDRPIEEKYKATMLQQGQWQATAVAKDPRHIGFHINRFYSPWKGWQDLCLDYESSRSDRQKLQVFWNATLGLPFELLEGEKLSWQNLRDRGSLSSYQQGTCPEGCLMLTAGVDVQSDRLEVAIWGWGRGEQAYVIRYEKIMGDPLQPDVWEQLYQVTSQGYPVQQVGGDAGASRRCFATAADSSPREEVAGKLRKPAVMTQASPLINKRGRETPPSGGHTEGKPTTHYLLPPTLRVRAVCVDSGYLTQEVYHWVRKFKSSHWFAIKGVSGDKPLVATPTTQQINYRGEKLKRGIKLYKVGVDLAKETLYSRSQISQPGAKFLNFPSDLDTNWYEGFCSEVQVTKHTNGRPYLVWEVLAGVRNEVLDTAVYSLAAAELCGISRISWSSLERKLFEQIKEEIVRDESEEKVSTINVRSLSEQRPSVRSRTRKRTRG